MQTTEIMKDERRKEISWANDINKNPDINKNLELIEKGFCGEGKYPL